MSENTTNTPELLRWFLACQSAAETGSSESAFLSRLALYGSEFQTCCWSFSQHSCKIKGVHLNKIFLGSACWNQVLIHQYSRAVLIMQEVLTQAYLISVHILSNVRLMEWWYLTEADKLTGSSVTLVALLTVAVEINHYPECILLSYPGHCYIRWMHH